MGRKNEQSKSEQSLVLKQLIDTVPLKRWLENIYLRRKSLESGDVYSPEYIVPVTFDEEQVFYLTRLGGDIIKTPFGLVYGSGPNARKYYGLKNDLSLYQTSRNKDLKYLQVRPVNLFAGLQNSEPTTIEEIKLKAYAVAGINGLKGLYPITIARKSENLIEHKGLYLDRGGLFVYSLDFENYERKITKLLEVHSLPDKINETKSEENVIKESSEIIIKKDIKVDFEKPKDIVEYLNKYIIGQERAKKVAAVSFSNYMLGIKSEKENDSKNDEGNFCRENLLLIGSSGVGKSSMIELLAEKAEIPFVKSESSGKTSEGYKGVNLSQIMQSFKLKVGDKKYPEGIICIDELDKSCLSGSDSDFFENKIQDQLIAWMSGTKLIISDKSEDNEIDTRRMMFIGIGAFQGTKDNTLEKIIRKRIGIDGNKIGFGQSLVEMENKIDYNKDILHKVEPRDLVNYGLKPELIGRFSSIAVFDRLSEGDKVKILRESENSPLKYKISQIKSRGFNVQINEEVMQLIAKKCPTETGARALSKICNDLFFDINFDPEKYAVGKEIVVDREMALKLLGGK